MITQTEKDQIKQEIIEAIEDKFKGVAMREDTQGVLSVPRNKWFRDVPKDGSKHQGSPMFELFGTVTYWAAWELIRKLTCIICGCGYVRQLKHQEFANEAAEMLCQTVYNLRKKYLSEQEAHNEH